MLAPIEAIDTEAEESVIEIEMEAEEAAPEVAEVLAKVPKLPRTTRPKLAPTKETMKDNKGKKLAITVHALPRRNPLKTTT